MSFKKEFTATLLIIFFVGASMAIYFLLGTALDYLTKTSSVSWIFYLFGYLTILLFFGTLSL